MDFNLTGDPQGDESLLIWLLTPALRSELAGDLGDIVTCTILFLSGHQWQNIELSRLNGSPLEADSFLVLPTCTQDQYLWFIPPRSGWCWDWTSWFIFSINITDSGLVPLGSLVSHWLRSGAGRVSPQWQIFLFSEKGDFSRNFLTKMLLSSSSPLWLPQMNQASWEVPAE